MPRYPDFAETSVCTQGSVRQVSFSARW